MTNSPHRLRWAVAATVAVPILLWAPRTGGQDLACPQAHVCVDYENTAIAIDPLQGPVQALVVKEQTVETVSFEGTETSNKATLAVYISNGDTYELQGEQVVDQEGLFAGAELGDVYVLTEVRDAD